VHKARELPKHEFKREVERELTAEDSKPSKLIYFKVFRSQVPVIEQAIETAALMLGSLMLGSDKSFRAVRAMMRNRI
jgi:hypothetical protein